MFLDAGHWCSRWSCLENPTTFCGWELCGSWQFLSHFCCHWFAKLLRSCLVVSSPGSFTSAAWETEEEWLATSLNLRICVYIYIQKNICVYKKKIYIYSTHRFCAASCTHLKFRSKKVMTLARSLSLGYTGLIRFLREKVSLCAWHLPTQTGPNSTASEISLLNCFWGPSHSSCTFALHRPARLFSALALTSESIRETQNLKK